MTGNEPPSNSTPDNADASSALLSSHRDPRTSPHLAFPQETRRCHPFPPPPPRSSPHVFNPSPGFASSRHPLGTTRMMLRHFHPLSIPPSPSATTANKDFSPLASWRSRGVKKKKNRTVGTVEWCTQEWLSSLCTNLHNDTDTPPHPPSAIFGPRQR